MILRKNLEAQPQSKLLPTSVFTHAIPPQMASPAKASVFQEKQGQCTQAANKEWRLFLSTCFFFFFPYEKKKILL